MKRSTVVSVITLGMLITVLGVVPLATAEDQPEASGEIAVLTKYVWRGFELSDGEAVIQPSTTLSYRGISFNLWGNLDTDYYLDEGVKFNETDITLSYARSLGPAALDIGYGYYAFDGYATGEAYVSASLETILSPSLGVYRDVDAFSSWYISLGISHSIDLGRGLALDLAASLGYLDIDDTDYQELHDGSVSAALAIPLGEYFALSPSITYSFGLSNEADAFIETGPSEESSFLFGGVTLTMAF